MIAPRLRLCKLIGQFCLMVGGLAAILLLLATNLPAQDGKKILHLGTSGSLGVGTSKDKQKAALDLLHQFIRDETGFHNEIDRCQSWSEEAQALAKGKLQLGVFQGYEFAWAQAKWPELKPLAVGINVHPYAEVHLIVNKNSPATAIAGLRGQALGLAGGGGGLPRLFVEREAAAAGQTPDRFFSRITSPNTIEDALDDVVDGIIQATVVDRAGLEAYRQRKPARFNRLKEIGHTPPVPLAVLAYRDKHLDDATVERFRNGLVTANQKEKGQTLLSLFRLTGFSAPPSDFTQVLAATRKAFPPPSQKTK